MSPPRLSSQTPNNVNPEEVYNVICAATSQDFVQIKASSDRLKELLEMTGTFDALSAIAAQRSLPLQVRQQSIIQLKNSSMGHWRTKRYVIELCCSLSFLKGHRSRLLTNEQRVSIRRRCIELLNEPDDVVSLSLQSELFAALANILMLYEDSLFLHLRPSVLSIRILRVHHWT